MREGEAKREKDGGKMIGNLLFSLLSRKRNIMCNLEKVDDEMTRKRGKLK